MKRILFIVLLALVTFPGAANNPLPSHPDTLRILAVGNSFSDDGTEYLPGLLEGAGIRNVIIARLYIGGCSLERHCREYDESGTNYIYSKSVNNEWELINRNATLAEGLRDEPWDIVTIQEVSNYSGTWETIGKWTPRLVSIIRKEVSNPAAAIVWHMTWAYASNSTHGAFKLYGNNQQKMYSAIAGCVKNVREQLDIPVVIPSGIAIHKARATRLNNQDRVPATSKVYQLTRDGFHLSRQHGRYIAACTWFEALIRPVLGISVKGNRYRMEETEFSISESDARLCQQCAIQATKELK